jgi:hypothetical protein
MNKEIAPVLAELSAVLKKHDMAGLLIVSNQTHVDWRIEVEASWSCARIEKDADGREGLRIRSKLEEYPSREAQKKTLESTVGTLVSMTDVLWMAGENIERMLKIVAQHVQFFGKSTRED